MSRERLRSKWGVLEATDTETLRQSLEYAGFGHLAEFIVDGALDFTAEISADWVEVLQLYDNLKKARRDKNILLRFGAIGENRVYPTYEGIGTITGRILVTTPNIQHLKRSSRDIIAPDAGNILLYPDFSQYEPGVLADDSGDRTLIEIYNSGDLYKALSLALFGTEEHRKTAKNLFLSFLYGMSQERMTGLIASFTKIDLIIAKNLVDSFFGRFINVPHWKQRLCDELLRTGRIGTRDGNYRYRRNKRRNTLTDVEKRWVISQRIQGTASLILKRCILRIQQEVPGSQFLIPMHDAVLYQVPVERMNQNKKLIEGVFLEEFSKECKTIKPKISFTPFYCEK